MPRIVIMGVSGTGKSTIGGALAAALGGVYLEGDTLHPPANVAKMARGEPLDDADRMPWLTAAALALRDHAPPAVLGCSALRRRYRDHIRSTVGGPVVFVHLTGSRDLIAARMAARQGHFMPMSLLDSQFATLEPPGDDETAISVDIGAEVDALIATVTTRLRTLAGS